jgi:hypothetical protein
LAKLRVLGMGYTAKDAIEEIQAAAPDCPGLDRETLPALLFAIMEREQGPIVVAARRALDLLLSTGLPEFLRCYLALQVARQAQEWTRVAGLADACRKAVEAAAPEEFLPAGVFYATLLPPLDLGKGLNSDLNRAFLADISASGGIGAGRDLLLRHCDFAAAEARLRLGQASAALSEAHALTSAPKVASIPLHRLLFSAAVQAGDAEAVRKTGQAWFEDSPLDISMWETLADAYVKIGDKSVGVRLLEDIQVLSRFLLSAESTAREA